MTIRGTRLEIRPCVAILSLALLLVGCAARQPCASTVLEQYYKSGRYFSELGEAAGRATRCLDSVPSSDRKAAIVLDIDETSLSNWSTIHDEGFCFDQSVWDRWVASATAPAIQPTLELYRTAIARGISVFFITARPESQRDATERNLRAAGFTTWARLIMKPQSTNYASAACFKARERCALSKEGWHIVLNVGDQPSDLSGECPSPPESIGVCADNAVLLPNPFYRVP